MSNLYWMADEQIDRLHLSFLRDHDRSRVDDRSVLIGIIFVNRNDLSAGIESALPFQLA